ncbi:MAG: ATP-dependent helicase, partial [Sphingomonas sp.]|nr:ATP-dependent helicase [Sphingomonas sp.]
PAEEAPVRAKSAGRQPARTGRSERAESAPAKEAPARRAPRIDDAKPPAPASARRAERAPPRQSHREPDDVASSETDDGWNGPVPDFLRATLT